MEELDLTVLEDMELCGKSLRHAAVGISRPVAIATTSYPGNGRTRVEIVLSEAKSREEAARLRSARGCCTGAILDPIPCNVNFWGVFIKHCQFRIAVLMTIGLHLPFQHWVKETCDCGATYILYIVFEYYGSLGKGPRTTWQRCWQDLRKNYVRQNVTELCTAGSAPRSA